MACSDSATFASYTATLRTDLGPCSRLGALWQEGRAACRRCWGRLWAQLQCRATQLLQQKLSSAGAQPKPARFEIPLYTIVRPEISKHAYLCAQHNDRMALGRWCRRQGFGLANPTEECYALTHDQICSERPYCRFFGYTGVCESRKTLL